MPSPRKFALSEIAFDTISTLDFIRRDLGARMSGPLAVIFGFLAIINAWSARRAFFILAFVALAVTTFRLAHRCVQLERKANRVNDSLADWLARLELRLQGVKGSGPGTYRQQSGDTEDAVSLTLMKDIQEYLEHNVGHALALSFTSTAALQYGQIVGNRFCPPLHFQSKKSDSVAMQASDWQAAIDVLSLHAAQLKNLRGQGFTIYGNSSFSTSALFPLRSADRRRRRPKHGLRQQGSLVRRFWGQVSRACCPKAYFGMGIVGAESSVFGG